MERKSLSREHSPVGGNVSISEKRIEHFGKLVDSNGSNGGFSAILQVRPGTHRFHFLVDGEWRISNDFATAVDSEGNLLNYLEASEYVDHDDFDYSRPGSISCTLLSRIGI